MTTTRLALDSSFSGLSLCLKLSDGNVISFSTNASRSSDLLPTELNALFTRSGTTPSDLAEICLTVGPGSFTGIRLGLATAEALRLLNPSLRITALPTLRALALQVVAEHHPQTSFALAVDAAGNQLYSQTFTHDAQPLSSATIEDLNTFDPPHPVYASPSLMLDATPLTTLDAAHLFTLAQDPAAHLPLAPFYLKPLTYKQVS